VKTWKPKIGRPDPKYMEKKKSEEFYDFTEIKVNDLKLIYI